LKVNVSESERRDRSVRAYTRKNGTTEERVAEAEVNQKISTEPAL
jgi:hypothetical protein